MTQDIDYMFEAMKIVAKGLGNNFDQTKIGRVIEKLDNNRYKVQIQECIHTVKSNFNYEAGERVFVLFPCGNKTDLYLYPNNRNNTIHM